MEHRGTALAFLHRLSLATVLPSLFLQHSINTYRLRPHSSAYTIGHGRLKLGFISGILRRLIIQSSANVSHEPQIDVFMRLSDPDMSI